MQRNSRSVLVTTVALAAASIVLAPKAQANPATHPTLCRRQLSAPTYTR